MSENSPLLWWVRFYAVFDATRYKITAYSRDKCEQQKARPFRCEFLMRYTNNINYAIIFYAFTIEFACTWSVFFHFLAVATGGSSSSIKRTAMAVRIMKIFEHNKYLSILGRMKEKKRARRFSSITVRADNEAFGINLTARLPLNNSIKASASGTCELNALFASFVHKLIGCEWATCTFGERKKKERPLTNGNQTGPKIN